MSRTGQRHTIVRGPQERRLRLEPLEDRHLLAVFTVDNLADAGAGSLRQAILDANAAAGADVIEFQAGVSGTILLSTGELLITDELTIDGPGDEVLTIDAQQNSRIFHITEESGAVTISGLYLTGGEVMGNGGAIFSETSAPLLIQSSRISDSAATGIGQSARGGGVYSFGDVSTVDSTITASSVTGNEFGLGGGVFAGSDATIIDSTIVGNLAIGVNRGNGGGIYADGDVTITGTTVSGNSAMGDVVGAGGGIAALGDLTFIGSAVIGNSATGDVLGAGGGLIAYGDLAVADSTISGNSASGPRSFGGGISDGDYFGGDGNLTVEGSSISGNSSLGDESGGGGIFAYGLTTIRNTTITGNLARGGGNGPFAGGGGISADHGPVTIENSIVATNLSDGSAPDGLLVSAPLTVRHSLIGDNTGTGLAEAPVGIPDANGNLIGDPAGAGVIDPMLGPLQNNGGPTFTHALLPGSPAIDAGDPAFAPPPFMDQRGFLRVADGGGGVKRIDMGAYEFASTLAGDGNGDGFVGPQDYTVWANNFGISGEDIPGDYNGDGTVGPQDYTIWANNHGNTGPPPEEVTVGTLDARAETVRRDKPGGSQVTARDVAIQQITIEAVADGRLSYVDRFWALLNAGLISFGDGDEVIGGEHRAIGR